MSSIYSIKCAKTDSRVSFASQISHDWRLLSIVGEGLIELFIVVVETREIGPLNPCRRTYVIMHLLLVTGARSKVEGMSRVHPPRRWESVKLCLMPVELAKRVPSAGRRACATNRGGQGQCLEPRGVVLGLTGEDHVSSWRGTKRCWNKMFPGTQCSVI